MKMAWEMEEVRFGLLDYRKGRFDDKGKEHFREGVMGRNAQCWLFWWYKKKGEEVRAKRRCRATCEVRPGTFS